MKKLLTSILTISICSAILISNAKAKEKALDEAGAILFKKVDPAVVAIQTEVAGGSGFIIDPSGYILTNGHVVSLALMKPDEEDPKAVVKRITVVTSDEKKYQAKVIGHSLDPDVALIKIETEKPMPVVALGNFEKVKVGQRCYAFGSPLGLKRTLTAGIVSNIERTDLGTYTKVIQTDAPINPGNSGGPLFNENGEVIGINTYSVGWGAEGLGFTIPINVAKLMKEHFIKYGRFMRADLPFFIVKRIDDDLAKVLGIEKGLLVDHVEQDSDIAKAGLGGGDIITEMNGKQLNIRTESDFRDFIWELTTQNIGSKIKFKVKRYVGKKYEEKTVEGILVEEEPMVEQRFQIGEIKEIRYDDLGLGIKKLTTAAFYFYNLPRVNGVRVTKVMPGTPASKTGLLIYDIITQIDDVPIKDADQFQSELESRLLKLQKYIRLTVVRKNDNLKLALVPEYAMKDKKILMLLPEKSTEYFDLVKRYLITNGASLATASKVKKINLSEKQELNCDMLIPDIKPSDFDGLLFLEGEGTKSYIEDSQIHELIKKAIKENKVLAAIGSMPLVLINADESLLKKKITLDKEYSKIASQKKANYTGKDVESDGKIVTSTGFDTKIVKSFLEVLKNQFAQ